MIPEFIHAARRGGLFQDHRYPWLDEARQGEWPYRELRWVWSHPVLGIGVVVWPIIVALIVTYLRVSG